MKNTGTGWRFLDEAGLRVLDNEGEEIYRYRAKPGDTFKWISGNEGYAWFILDHFLTVFIGNCLF